MLPVEIHADHTEVSANDGVHIKLKSSYSSLQDNMSLLQQHDGLQWIAQLKDHPDAEWEFIEEAHEHWKHKAQGLTPAGAALVTIAAGVATCGVSLELQTAIGGIPEAVASAGFTRLTSIAAVSAINHQGCCA